MEFKNSKTRVNLMKGFAGESQATERYMMYAKKAKKDGYVKIAKVFEETALNERAHAKTFYKLIQENEEHDEIEITASFPMELGTTSENLQYAANGENGEHTSMYPEFADVAEEEGYKKVAAKFRMIAKVEAAHEAKFLQLKKLLDEGTFFEREGKVYWRCLNCGYVVEAEKAPKVCPACDHPQGYFEEYSL
ncbi:MAG: rubrerythrin family protein [Tissierellia bacterium]|nr:rubrerythrin family protein [Tissierellia bacterium]